MFRFRKLSASRYAGALRDAVRPAEPARLLDLLLVGAVIEARSCERFARIAPRLPDRIAAFYTGLLAAESRHFEHYLALARTECRASDDAVSQRLAQLLDLESRLITQPDTEFRFHSGIPAEKEPVAGVIGAAARPCPARAATPLPQDR